MMLFTSGWLASPTTVTAYPSRLKERAYSWAFFTNGHVASMICTSLPASASASRRVMPWERTMTLPQGISSTDSTTCTPFFSSSSTACGLWIRGPSEWMGWASRPARPPPASHAFGQPPEHPLHHLVHGERRGVDAARSFRHAQRRMIPGTVLDVPQQHLPQHLFEGLLLSGSPLPEAAHRPDGRMRVQEELGLRLRES